MAQRQTYQAYVNVTNRRSDGFVEFDFSFGDADLYIEMILPEAAFEEFCTHNDAARISPEQAARWEAERQKWREGGL
ncbi:phenol hydroxylase subunit [Arhodomonas aquaeolei]|uniref:phenol hydroxylase subunit n=1 Tax=Arhodomonas aquaeolei TaxID=2369 RepID=UPI0021686627|nr:phenol hydroxylase subunit [Arhodomonas aquaeolei]